MATWSFILRCVVPGGGLRAAVASDKWHALDPSQPSPAIERIASILTTKGLWSVRVDHGAEPDTLTVMGHATGESEDAVRAAVEPLVVDAIETEFVGAAVKQAWLSREP